MAHSGTGSVSIPKTFLGKVYPHPEMCTIKHENHAQCLKLIQKAMEDPAVRPQAVVGGEKKVANRTNASLGQI